MACALDQAALRCKAKPSCNAAGGKTIDVQVAKAINDNLKGWGAMELDGSRDADGLTCRQRIKARKELNSQNPGKYPLGKKFYDELRATFSASDSPRMILRSMAPSRDQGEISDSLLKAMVIYKKTGSRSKMLSVVSQCNSFNLVEMHGILQFALEQRSHTSFEQMRMSKALLALFARLDLCTIHPDEMKVVKQWMDDAVGFLYMKAKQVNMPPSKFIACNRELVGLVLPLDDVDVLVEHRGPWSEKQVELVAVVSSSELGRMIFGFAIEQVMGSIVRADTEVAIQAMLDNNGVITEAVYNTAKMKCIESLEKKDGMAELSDKREVTILYRSAEFQVKVVSLMDEVEMRFASCLKSRALRTEELSPILCESDLVNDTGAGKKGQIGQEILEPWQQARASCNDHLRATGQLDGPAVVTFLARKEAALRSVDPTFAIEMLFFSSMVGKGGEKLLQAQILELMPTRTTTMEAKSVLSSLKKLQCSELYKFTGVASQNAVVSVSQLIQHLEEGRQPSFASNPDPFMAEMKLAISNFCKHKQQDGTLLSGADAVTELAKGLKDLKKIRIEDLEMPVKFSWLLSPGLATEVETMRKQALMEASSSIASVVAKAKRGGGAGSSSSSPTLRVLKKSKSQQVSELDAALAMFKGSS